MTRTELDTIEDQHLPPIAKAHWQARLRLGFSDAQGVTRLTERVHSGPLRVQKPLYPEGDAPCHAIIIHPPGGVVGGDQLCIQVAASSKASALITTPGAAKWYRGNGYTSQQQVSLTVGEHASLEWLPQETIFFDDAHVRLEQSIQLAKGASFIGADILCFGRTASGEQFNTGKISQLCEIRREGKLIWYEQGHLLGGSTAMLSPLGLRGHTVCATVLACGKSLTSAELGILREESAAFVGQREPAGICGVTQMKSILIARFLGNSSETAKHWMTLVWQHLRPLMLDRPAQIPRIWNT